MRSLVPFSAEYRNILNDYLLRIARASMRDVDVTLVIFNSLRIKYQYKEAFKYYRQTINLLPEKHNIL